MSLFSRAINWVLGNGYDLAKDDDTVLRHKEGTKACIEASESHFSLLQRKFDDMPTPDPDADVDVDTEHSSISNPYLGQ